MVCANSIEVQHRVTWNQPFQSESRSLLLSFSSVGTFVSLLAKIKQCWGLPHSSKNTHHYLFIFLAAALR